MYDISLYGLFSRNCRDKHAYKFFRRSRDQLARFYVTLPIPDRSSLGQAYWTRTSPPLLAN